MSKFKSIWNTIAKILGTFDMIFLIGMGLFLAAVGIWDKINNYNE